MFASANERAVVVLCRRHRRELLARLSERDEDPVAARLAAALGGQP